MEIKCFKCFMAMNVFGDNVMKICYNNINILHIKFQNNVYFKNIIHPFSKPLILYRVVGSKIIKKWIIFNFPYFSSFDIGV